MRRRNEDGIIYFPQKENKEISKELQYNLDAEISIILNNEKHNGLRPFYLLDPDEDEIHIHTIIPPHGSIKYLVNGQNYGKTALKEILSNLSINPDDPFLFLEQNKTTELLEGGPIGLMDALEDSLDIKEIRENLENALTSYDESRVSYQEIQTKLNALKSEVDQLRKEYDKYQEIQKIKSKICQLENELVASKYREVCTKFIKYTDELSQIEQNIIKITDENKSYTIELDAHEKDLKEKNKEKTNISTLINELNQNLGENKGNKKTESKLLIKIQEELDIIESLKKINKVELLSKTDSLEEEYLSINSTITRKQEELINIKKDIKALEKGKLIGPVPSQQFLKILKKDGIKADLLINAITIDKENNEQYDRTKEIQLFESILNEQRWAIVIFGEDNLFKKAIVLARDNHFNNFIIHLNHSIAEKKVEKLGFEGMNLNIQYPLIKSYLEDIIKNFNKKNIDYETGIIIQDFGVRYFKLNPGNLNLDRNNRLKILMVNKKGFEIEIKDFKRRSSNLKKQIKENTKQLHNLEKIDNEPNLIIERNQILENQREYESKINNIETKLKINESNLDKIELLIELKTQEKAKLEMKIEQNSKEINDFLDKKSNLLLLTNKLENEKEKYEKEKLKIIKQFPSPRGLDYLNDSIEELNTEIIKIGEVNFDSVKDYELKNEAYKLMSHTLIQVDNDLKKKIENAKRYQNEYKAFIDSSLRELQKYFSILLKRIGYDGKIIRNLYRSEGIRRKKKLRIIEETPDTILNRETFYGMDIKIKKPGDKTFVDFFTPKARVSPRHSGGQRALIMLAYLLSIQKSIGKATSFYILDEPTPQLDPTNNSFILQLFSETNVQIILFTPNPMSPEYFDEIIAILDQKIKKIPHEVLKELQKTEDLEIGNLLRIKKNGV